MRKSSSHSHCNAYQMPKTLGMHRLGIANNRTWNIMLVGKEANWGMLTCDGLPAETCGPIDATPIHTSRGVREYFKQLLIYQRYVSFSTCACSHS
jgi:hypothetical protein